jgi:5-formyltetrahydrofolate cyclo-ligase
MARDFADKSAARQWVWDRLSAEGVARFPFPPHGRIPNFAGAEVAAARLLDIEPWKSATAIKVNPDSSVSVMLQDRMTCRSSSSPSRSEVISSRMPLGSKK